MKRSTVIWLSFISILVSLILFLSRNSDESEINNSIPTHFAVNLSLVDKLGSCNSLQEHISSNSVFPIVIFAAQRHHYLRYLFADLSSSKMRHTCVFVLDNPSKKVLEIVDQMEMQSKQKNSTCFQVFRIISTLPLERKLDTTGKNLTNLRTRQFHMKKNWWLAMRTIFEQNNSAAFDQKQATHNLPNCFKSHYNGSWLFLEDDIRLSPDWFEAMRHMIHQKESQPQRKVSFISLFNFVARRRKQNLTELYQNFSTALRYTYPLLTTSCLGLPSLAYSLDKFAWLQILNDGSNGERVYQNFLNGAWDWSVAILAEIKARNILELHLVPAVPRVFHPVKTISNLVWENVDEQKKAKDLEWVESPPWENENNSLWIEMKKNSNYLEDWAVRDWDGKLVQLK